MIAAAELVPMGAGLWLWQAYDPVVKSDLFSTAAKSGAHLFLIDPIPLAPGPRAELRAQGEVTGVLVTNSNHPRAAADFARQLGATIFAAEPVVGQFEDAKTQSIAGKEIMAGVAAIPLAGAATGEMA